MPLGHSSFRDSVNRATGGTGASGGKRPSGGGAAIETRREGQNLAERREASLREIELRIERFPSLPSVVFEIERVANDSGASMGDFDDAIRVDPVVTAKVLRLANSAFYARARPVSTIRDAVGSLGVKTLRSLVLAAATGGVMERRLDAYGYSPDGLWKHSFAAALCSRAAARKITGSERVQEEVFVAGLLHDIGKMILEPLLAPAGKGTTGARLIPTPGIEAEQLGWDHARVGELIVAKWKLPPEIGEAIIHHHDPEAATAFPLHTSVLVLANEFVKDAGIGLTERVAIEGAEPIVTPTLDAAATAKIREDLSAEIAEVRALCDQLAGS